MIDLPLSRKQVRSIAHAEADASQSQINLWHGAVRSGKTVGSLWKFLMKTAELADKPGEIFVIGRTRDTAYRNLLSPLMSPSMFGVMTEQIEYNRGAPTAKILGQRVHVIGASDVRSENAIRGATVKLSYCDEISLMAEEFVSQLVARHSVEGAWMGATTNPDGPRHWLKTGYIDRADEIGHRIFHFELEDNRAHLPTGFIEGLELQYTGMWRDRFVRGLWTMAEGVIYEAFDPKRHVVDSLPSMRRIVSMGIDWGSTNPTRGILLGLGEDDRLYAMAEWAPTSATSNIQVPRIQQFIAEHGTPDYFFVDPSAKDLREQMTQAGLVNVAKGSNKVKPGIDVTAALLSSERLLIHSSCSELLDEIPGYVWDSKAQEKGEDEPVKLNDHAVDALRYAVFSSRALWQPFMPNLHAAKMQPDEKLELEAA